MRNRMLTLDDLYNFYASHTRSSHFSSSKSNELITVAVEGKIDFKKSEKKDENPTEGLTKVTLQSCHTQLNRNDSFISDENMEKALPSFSNRPILARLHKVDDAWEFGGHDFHEEDGDLIYDEVPVGIIPESCDAKLEYDEDKKKTYVVVDGYIFDEYSHAKEVLEREQECKVSVELSIREMSYNAKEKCLEIEDFIFSGVTILGKTDSGRTIEEGMLGSNIKLADFKKNENQDYAQQMVEMQEKLNYLLSCFETIQKSDGKEEPQMNHFEELLEKYGKSVEDIDFDYESMTDEELDAKFEELFSDVDPEDEGAEGDGGEEEAEGTPEEAEDANDDETNPEDTDDTTDPEEGGEPESENNEGNDAEEETAEEFSVTYTLGTQVYQRSLNDKIYALYSLINATYAEADNTWYSVEVFDDHVVMIDSWNGRYFKQTYAEEEDNFTLTGDRIEVYTQFLTQEEIDSLEEMRSNYSQLVEYKENIEKNELKAQKESILSDDKYSVLAEEEAFKNLYADMDKFSIEELETKVKVLLADHVTSVGTYSYEKKQEGVKLFAKVDKKKKNGRYGNLFA